jgi:sulfoxide reductase catalytic subunit YedY
VIKIKKKSDIAYSEITPESVYLRRREIMKSAGLLGTALLLNPWLSASASIMIGDYRKKVVSLDEDLTPEKHATSYNNFYEFGTDKEDPKEYSTEFNTDDWKITVGGECEKPGTYALEDLIKPFNVEERIYRLRCVETWSMVIPWLGIPLASIIKSLQPTSKAKYVAFKTLHDPKQMPGQNRSVLEWPYREGLRIDEAVNPLTLFAIGMYGKTMPNQNGAPIRLVIPWKYGFKSIKSIVRIDFVEEQPQTSWNMFSAQEYGFYSNVNPNVKHPRWSQKKEHRITGSLLDRLNKFDTQIFNGYGEEVAHLYDGMDLRVNF